MCHATHSELSHGSFRGSHSTLTLLSAQEDQRRGPGRPPILQPPPPQDQRRGPGRPPKLKPNVSQTAASAADGSSPASAAPSSPILSAEAFDAVATVGSKKRLREELDNMGAEIEAWLDTGSEILKRLRVLAAAATASE